MATDLDLIHALGTLKRDDPLGFRTILKLFENDENLANVIENHELDNEGKARSRKFVRITGTFLLAGGPQYELEGQSQESKLVAVAAIPSTGTIQVLFSPALPTADYDVQLTWTYDSTSFAPITMGVAGDAAERSTSGVQLRATTVSSSPAAVNPYGFSIAISYEGA